MAVALLYNNLADTATLALGSWDSALPLLNLQTRDLGTVARSVDAQTASTIIGLDHGAAKTARAVALVGHNLSSAATVTIKRGTSSGGSDVYSGSAVNAWQIVPTTYDGSAFWVVIFLPADTSARYTTIEISDAGNSDGYVQIGRLFVGPAFLPARAAVHGLTDGWMNDFSIIERTSFGADWVHERQRLRHLEYSWPVLTTDEGAQVHEIMRTHGITGEVGHIRDNSDPAANQRYGFLGVMREMSRLEYPYPMNRGIAIAIDERGGAV